MHIYCPYHSTCDVFTVLLLRPEVFYDPWQGGLILEDIVFLKMGFYFTKVSLNIAVSNLSAMI